MSLTTRALLVAGLLAAWVAPAAGQGFLPEDPRPDGDADGTEFDGQLTSTSVAHYESGGIGTPVVANGAAPETVSPFGRYFTDLRAVLDADRIAGDRFELRLDTRLRYVPDGAETSNKQDDGTTLSFQSGKFGDPELDVRELYVRRRGDKLDAYAGRQFVLDVTALKIDGVRLVYKGEGDWDYLAFAGLNPARGSRSIFDDYPQAAPNPADPMAATARIMPVAAGVGMAYRSETAWGALGAGAVVPLADDLEAGTQERPRVFVSSQGYWRKSDSLDVFHYAVVDVTGAAGAAVNNLSVGLNFHPTYRLRVSGLINHVDTETLNAIAQAELEAPDPNVAAGGQLQNNIRVQRVAQQSARLSVSAGFSQQRFELTTAGIVRRRPQFDVALVDGTPFTFDEQRAADVTISLLDRRSLLGTRLSGSITRVFGVGDLAFARSESVFGNLRVAKELNDGRSELEFDLGFALSQDQGSDPANPCVNAANPLICYGTAKTTTLSLGALAFHRLSNAFMLVGSVQVAQMSMTASDNVGARVEQPTATLVTGLLRLDFRF